jgi:uncharacterized protein DUF6883
MVRVPWSCLYFYLRHSASSAQRGKSFPSRGETAWVFNHWKGGPKARGFELILGITLNEIEYLASRIEAGVLDIAISDVRNNSPYGFTCEVLVPVNGFGTHSGRVVVVTTAWELTDARALPRLVNAYIRD